MDNPPEPDQPTKHLFMGKKVRPGVLAAIFALAAGAYMCLYATSHIRELETTAEHGAKTGSIWHSKSGHENKNSKADPAEEEEPELRELRARNHRNETGASAPEGRSPHR